MTGLDFGPQVTVVEDVETATAILRRARDFPQWDGSFRTADGRIIPATATPTASVTGPGPHDGPAAAGATLIASASGLIPESDAGPFCFAQTPVFLDGPQHARFRRLLTGSWLAGAAARDLEQPAARLAADLLDQHAAGPPAEFIRSVATPLASTMLAWFFGGPPGPWIELALEHQSRNAPGRTGFQPALTAFQQHVWGQLEQRASCPQDDALTRMARHHPGAGALWPAEIATLVLQTALVSNETVIRLLGSVAAAMAARRPSPGDVSGIRQLVSDVLRDQPPLRGVFRRTTAACAAGETRLPAGTGLFVDLRQAGGGAGGGHLAFGTGAHRCPGAALATMQALVLARALAGRPGLKIAPGGRVDEPDGLVEGPSELWLEL